MQKLILVVKKEFISTFWSFFFFVQLKSVFPQIKEQHRGDQMTPGPKSQLLSGIVVDTIPGPVSLLAVHLSVLKWNPHESRMAGSLWIISLGGWWEELPLSRRRRSDQKRSFSSDVCSRFHHVWSESTSVLLKLILRAAECTSASSTAARRLPTEWGDGRKLLCLPETSRSLALLWNL